MSIFSLFSNSSFSFEGQLSDEHTLIVLRSHWFILLGVIIGFIIAALVPLILYIFIGNFLVTYGFESVYWFLVAIYYLILWNSLFYRLLTYFLTVWIVTDHRIISNEQRGLFDREVAELNITKVQDVEVKIIGLIPTFLNFGDLDIQTAGEEKNFVFKNIPNPLRVKDIIIESQRKFLTMHPNGVEPDGV